MIKEFVVSNDSITASSTDDLRKIFGKLMFDLSRLSKASSLFDLTKIDVLPTNTQNVEFYTAKINLQKNQLIANLNKTLSDSYFLGLSKHKNTDKQGNIYESDGESFYDHTFSFDKPLNLNKKEVVDAIGDSNFSKTAKIVPTYNFFDKDNEIVTSNLSLLENALINFYVLNFFFLQDAETKQHQAILEEFKTFIAQVLAVYEGDALPYILALLSDYKLDPSKIVDTANELQDFLSDSKTFIAKVAQKNNNIIFGADQVSLLPNLESKKPLYAFGMDLFFSSQPKGEIGEILEKVNSSLSLLQKLNSTDLGFSIFEENIDQSGKSTTQQIDIALLENSLVKDIILSNNSAIFDEASEQILTLNDNKTGMMQKINNFLLQKKLKALVLSKKRTYAEILSGKEAYQEVIFYEIEKKLTPTNQETKPNLNAIQNIFIPNVSDSSMMNYFDTQVKYDKGYTYKIWTWNLVIGNKFKYFDRIDQPAITTFTKPTDIKDPFFKWLAALLKAKDLAPNDIMDLVQEPNVSSKLSGSSAVDFSKILTFAGDVFPISFVDGQFLELSKIYVTLTDIVDSYLFEASNADVSTLPYSFQIGKDINDLLAFSGNNKSKEYSQQDVRAILLSLSLITSSSFSEDLNKQVDSVLPFQDFVTKFKDFYSKSTETKDLSKENLTFELDQNSNYYPRFKYIGGSQTKAQVQFGVLNEEDIRMLRVPYFDYDSASIVSAPPIFPDVQVIPYKNVDNKLLFLLTNSVDEYRDLPVAIEQTDSETFDKAQKIDEAIGLFDDKITFNGDEPASKFQVFKSTEKPDNFSSFTKLVELTLPIGGFVDNVRPNLKNYYFFRSVDMHGMVSNPSPIFEVELINNSGAVYPVINIFYFEKKKDFRLENKFKRFMQIETNKDHILLNNSNLQSAYDVEKLGNIGSTSSSLFNQPEFKLRLQSCSTKKKLDINLTFKKVFVDSTVNKVKPNQKPIIDLQQEIIDSLK